MRTNKIRKLTFFSSIVCIVLFCGCTIPLTKGKWNDGEGLRFPRLIDQLLRTGNKVSILSVPGHIQTQNLSEGVTKTDVSNRLIGVIEKDMIKWFGNRHNFSIVNRTYLNSQIQEMLLSNSGLVSEDTRIKLGQLTGSTHLLVVNIYQSGTMGYNKWIIQLSFIDIQTGRILSIDEEDSSSFNII